MAPDFGTNEARQLINDLASYTGGSEKLSFSKYIKYGANQSVDLHRLKDLAHRYLTLWGLADWLSDSTYDTIDFPEAPYSIESFPDLHRYFWQADAATTYCVAVVEGLILVLEFDSEGEQNWKVLGLDAGRNFFELPEFLFKLSKSEKWSTDVADAERAFQDSGSSVQAPKETDDYWDRYDDDMEGDEPSTEAPPVENDEEFYKQYDTVETAVQGDSLKSDPVQPSAIESHITTTIGSLHELSQSSGMSTDQFSSIVLDKLRSCK